MATSAHASAIAMATGTARQAGVGLTPGHQPPTLPTNCRHPQRWRNVAGTISSSAGIVGHVVMADQTSACNMQATSKSTVVPSIPCHPNTMPTSARPLASVRGGLSG